MSALVYLILGCIPPLLAGPLAGIAYLEILKRKQAWHQVLFWASLVLLDLLVMFWVLTSSGKWLSIASLSAFCFTPVAAILSVFVMAYTRRKFGTTHGAGAVDKHWFTLGIVLIPLLQMGLFVVLIIYAPWLCKVGLIICRAWQT